MPSKTAAKQQFSCSAASEAWELFGSIGIGKLAEEKMPELFQKVEIIEGDGGVATILKLTFTPGRSFSISICCLLW
jgi:hypothetical protein